MSDAPFAAAALAPPTADAVERVDVLVVGAGISGIGAGRHLKALTPHKSFLILEAQESYGGTWLTHKYPGVRSDSDLYTFGYAFKPWTGKPIATAQEILAYLGEVIEENGLAAHIRYGAKILEARWSSPEALWTVTGIKGAERTPFAVRANFLWMCQGYYRHEEGYTPEWPGMARFKGPIIHPQTWPKDVELKGKRALVIGSGATAATLAPAIAGDCAHVTVLQRSPTYFIPGRNANDLADTLRQLEVDESWIHEIVRRKILFDQEAFTRRSFEEPEAVRAELLAGVAAFVGEEEVRRNFTPTYRPWRQRIAFIPDGDLLAGIAAGKASVTTGQIETFTETGVRLASGEKIEADLVITATGFHLSAMGDVRFFVDDALRRFGDTVGYRGMMFTGVPNMVWVFGYFRASWTLRADLVAAFVCRLLSHMDATGARAVEVALRPEDQDMPLHDWIDPENFNPGYLLRGMSLLPRRGDKPEWSHTQDYWMERTALPAIDLEDEVFRYAP
jgi:cation diffusion facilitator CzcD-associated flavoprotein CzcO